MNPRTPTLAAAVLLSACAAAPLSLPFVRRHRTVVLSDDGQVAWFDESLDSAAYGDR